MSLNGFTQRWTRYKPFAKFARGVSLTLRGAKPRAVSVASLISGSRASSAVLKQRRERPRPSLAPIPCSFTGCTSSAVARVQAQTGLANVCASHYSFLAQREAELHCDAQGLVSIEDKRAYCRVMMSGFGKVSFESWARSLTPGAVALLVRLG